MVFMMKMRVGSITLAYITTFLTNISFVIFLPDTSLSLVIGVMALSALVSGSTVSNNTAKILSKIASKENLRCLSQDSLTLFVFEQLTALIFLTGLFFMQSQWLPDLSSIELVSLILVSCTGALVAFARVNDKFFIGLNLVRAASAIARLIAVFWLVSVSALDWIPVAIIVSLAVPMSFALYFALSLRSSSKGINTINQSRLLIMLREYLWGIPVAVSRAFVKHGMVLASVNLLKADELRMFRFLLLPIDAFGKVFNAFLPLFFDRMFGYSIRLYPTLIIVVFGMVLATSWYFLANMYFGFGASALLTYTVYLMLNLTVYSVLPISWRAIYSEKAINIAIVVICSSLTTFLIFFLRTPSNINDILILLSIYSCIYIFGMVLLFRLESARGSIKS